MNKQTKKVTYNITDHIEYIKTLEPIEAMKEANKVLKGEGRYKGLSKADQETIVNDETVTDHIFERNVDPDPEDFAQGGRVGYSHGFRRRTRRFITKTRYGGRWYGDLLRLQSNSKKTNAEKFNK